MTLNGNTKYFMIGIPLILSLVGYIVANDQLSRTRDELLQKEITRVEMAQTQQYGSIQTSLMRIETRLGIDE